MKSNNSRNHITNVIIKEWVAMLKNPGSLLFVTLLPLLIIIQFLAVVFIISAFISRPSVENTIVIRGLEALYRALPAVQALGFSEQFRIFLLRLYPVYVLLVPTMVAMTFSTYSIIEEKQAGTLEFLLVTPLKEWEYFLGKTISGSLPALLLTWLSSGVFILGIVFMGQAALLRYIFQPEWFFSLFVIVPLVTLLSYLMGIIISAAARDAKNAQSIAVIIILPVMILIGLHVAGIIGFNLPAMLLVAGVALVLCLGALKLAAYLLNREIVITRWN